MYCDFKEATIIEMMRDRLVCGTRAKRLQQRLLAEPDNVPFDKALKIAQSFEVAEKDAKDMKRHDPSDRVSVQVATHKQQQSPSHKPSLCFICGANHNPSTCRFKQEQCHSCGKTGHIAKVCRSKPKSSNHSWDWSTITHGFFQISLRPYPLSMPYFTRTHHGDGGRSIKKLFNKSTVDCCVLYPCQSLLYIVSVIC